MSDGASTGERIECGQCWSHEACGRYGCQREAQAAHSLKTGRRPNQKVVALDDLTPLERVELAEAMEAEFDRL